MPAHLEVVFCWYPEAVVSFPFANPPEIGHRNLLLVPIPSTLRSIATGNRIISTRCSKKNPEDAWYSELFTTAPVDTPVKSEDDATAQGTGASPDSEGLSTVMPWGLCWREAYCLLV